jgi:hypothetical protein
VEADERGDDAPSRVRRGSGHVRAAGASAAEIKGKQYTSHGAAMFDPSKERYAVTARFPTEMRSRFQSPTPHRRKNRASATRGDRHGGRKNKICLVSMHFV